MIRLGSLLSRGAPLAVVIASTLIACGGKVVVDAEGVTAGAGGGGGGGGAGAGGGGSGSTSGGFGGCYPLQAEVKAKLEAAQACNPVLAVVQCSGAVVAKDLCGCTVVANDTTPMKGQAALEAFDAWISAGCGPFLCEFCPPGPDTAWYCDGATSTCKPAFEK